MSAAHVRRGAPARPKKRAPKPRVPKRIASKLPVDQAGANRLAGLAFAAFLLAIAIVVIALDIPSKAATSNGAGRARRLYVKGYSRRSTAWPANASDEVVDDELRRAARQRKARRSAGRGRGDPQRLLQFGWVKDARVSRRLPTLVIEIVSADGRLWPDGKQLALIDAEGVVLDACRRPEPDMPLWIGGANAHARELKRRMSEFPTLKRNWPPSWMAGLDGTGVQTGETVPAQGERRRAGRRPNSPRTTIVGLLGRGLVRFDWLAGPKG